MSSEPRYSTDDREVISFTAVIADRPIVIAIDRETIEDYLGAVNMDPEARMSFVTLHTAMLIASAKAALAGNDDATGVMLKTENLRASPN